MATLAEDTATAMKIVSGIVGGTLLLAVAGTAGVAAAGYVIQALRNTFETSASSETMGGNQAALSGGIYRVPRLVRLK